METKPLIEYFDKIAPLDEDETSFVEQAFKYRKVKRREFILQEGDICKLHTFILEGFFRTYTLDDNGNEHNLQFATENWWIGDITSFHKETPTKLYIKAVENSIVLQISKKDLMNLFEEYPKFNKIFRVLAQNAMASMQERIEINISDSAEERYLKFIAQHQGLLNRVSNVQIASYLGVTPEFLSAIRKKLARK